MQTMLRIAAAMVLLLALPGASAALLRKPEAPLLEIKAILNKASGAAPAPAPMAAPGPGPSPGPHPHEKQVVHCGFTIRNLDYDEVMEHDQAENGVRHAIKNLLDVGAENAVMGIGLPGPAPGPAGPAAAAGPSPGPGGAALPPAGPAPALFQMRSILVHARSNRSNATGAASGPAPGPAGPAAAPVAGPAGSPALSPAPLADNVDTFVTLSEGRHDAVQVDAFIHPSPENFANVENSVHQLCNPISLGNALLNTEEVSWAEDPVVTSITIRPFEIKRWGLDCGPHVTKVINAFTVAYTRVQVPNALEDACTLFSSKISFSGNNRITKWDRIACKKMTKKLMDKWKYGKGKIVDSNSDWCHDICESKMGNGHPMCAFNEGANFNHPGTK